MRRYLTRISRYLPIAVLGMLAWASPSGFAASFDCGKAGTAVEKMICADSVISKLDEDLAAAYRNALATAPDKEALRRQQREWLTQSRDRCRDPACLKATYQQRLAQVKAPPADEPASAEVAKDRKYPPYPEVWGVEFDDPGHGRIAVGGLFPAANGDVLVRYLKKQHRPSDLTRRTPCDAESQYAYREFFGQKDHLISCDDSNHFEERFAMPGITRENIYQYHTSKRFQDGASILAYGSPTTGCGEPFSAYYELHDATDRVIWRKSLFLSSDEPKSYQCKDEPYEYTLSFETHAPRVVHLEDDTFLVRLTDRVVVRFDRQFSTQFPLDGKRVAIVDYVDVQAVIERAKQRCSPYTDCLDNEMRKYLDTVKH